MAALAGAAAAQQPLDPCMKAYNDEVVAIEHEAKTKQNVGSDAAKQRAAAAAQARLEAAARQAKACQEKVKAGVTEGKPPAPATEADCNARASERLAGIERRYSGSPEQAGRGGEEVQVSAERADCIRRARAAATPAKPTK